MYPFERFTAQAKRALSLAQQEAERSHKSYIGTEHLLLGLFQVDGGMAQQILADLGVEIGTVRDVVKGILGRNERIAVQQIIPTSRVKAVIEIAFEESRRTGSRSVGTQHLLLGLLIEGEGIAAHVLKDLGVTVDRVREAIGRLSAEGVREGEAPGGPPPHPFSPDPHRMARTLDDLTAVELLAALQDRFGTPEPPPAGLVKVVAELRGARRQEQDAAAAQDYDAAKHHREEVLRLEAVASDQLDAWRRNT